MGTLDNLLRTVFIPQKPKKPKSKKALLREREFRAIRALYEPTIAEALAQLPVFEATARELFLLWKGLLPWPSQKSLGRALSALGKAESSIVLGSKVIKGARRYTLSPRAAGRLLAENDQN